MIIMNLKISPARSDDGELHYIDSPMYKAFMPVLYSLKLGGLYYERDAIKKYNRVTLFNQLYSILVMIILWAVALINLYSLTSLTRVDSSLFSFLSSILLTFQCAINSVCLFAASFSEKGWKKFFICLANLDNYYGGVFTDSNWFKKIAVTSCFIAWFMFVSIVIFGIILLFGVQ